MSFRPFALMLALVGAVIALTGCGVSKVIDPVADAATKTENAGGAKLAMTISVDAPSASKQFSITANGEFDKTQADITMDLSSALAGSGLSLPSGSGAVELRYLQESGDPVVYANLGFLASEIPGGKSWVRLDLAQAAKSAGIDLGQLMGQSNQNPGQILDMLRASGSVTTVGSETVNGASTTHYKASVDLSKLPQLQGKVGQELTKQLSDAGITDVPFDVWIGDDGLVHRLTMTEALKGVNVAVTLDISDYGTDVNVSAPASDQVFDATGLASMLGGTASGGSASLPAPAKS
ncbi:MAG TPA: LppX_LprAFG lipoprotein [Gaiellaceae bacterium]